MANIKSAKKRIKISATRQARNKLIKSKTKMFVKKIILAVNNKNVEEANNLLKEATKQIDMACTKGVYHKNNAARKVSRIQHLVNSINK